MPRCRTIKKPVNTWVNSKHQTRLRRTAIGYMTKRQYVLVRTKTHLHQQSETTSQCLVKILTKQYKKDEQPWIRRVAFSSIAVATGGSTVALQILVTVQLPATTLKAWALTAKHSGNSLMLSHVNSSPVRRQTGILVVYPMVERLPLMEHTFHQTWYAKMIKKHPTITGNAVSVEPILHAPR